MGQNTRLAELRSAIDRTAQLYHTPGCISPIDDAEYDALMNELRSIDPSDERLTRVGTPYSSSGMRQEVDHKMPMGSLDNTIGSIAGFEPWYANVCSLAGAHSLDVNASLKMDGLSVELIYEVGKFKQAVTRGNGSVGLDITANAVRWIGVPTVLSAPFSGSIRGECMLYHSEFEQIKQANPGEDYSNERNLCSGIAGRTDGKDNEKLHFVAFNFVSEKLKMPTLTHKFKALGMLGFDVVQHRTINIDSAPEHGRQNWVVANITEWFNELASGGREQLPFDIDGLVVIVDSVEVQEKLTRDEKDALRPRYGRAIKWEAKTGTSTVLGIELTVGHSGAIIPTAKLEPVNVGGVEISSALLNNWNHDSDAPSAAHVAVGDLVVVSRQADVIPKITSVVSSMLRCPKCGFVGTKDEQESHHQTLVAI